MLVVISNRHLIKRKGENNRKNVKPRIPPYLTTKQEILFLRRMGFPSLKNMENKKICFLDTEFNATSYADQNDGYQEITEIGAVVFQDGKVVDTFQRFCRLKEGHKLTKRCKKITGITQEVLNENGIRFNDAMKEFREFLDKHNLKRAYAFGNADAIEMRTTAKLNGADAGIYETIKMIYNIYPKFQKQLELHYVFSLMDICRICNVDHGAEGRAHSAMNDAEDTGLAFFNMKQNKINLPLLKEINTHKYNVGIYRDKRSVKMANIKRPPVVTAAFINDIETVFDNAREILNEPIVRALHDDMMRVMGRPDLEQGEDGL